MTASSTLLSSILLVSYSHIPFPDHRTSPHLYIKKKLPAINMKHLTLDPNRALPATRDLPAGATVPDSLPRAKETKVHPSGAGGENARLLFVGTATVVLYVVFFFFFLLDFVGL